MDYLLAGWIEKNIQGEICLDYVCSKQYGSLQDAKNNAKNLKYWEIRHWEFVKGRGYIWNPIPEESKYYV